MKTRNYLAIAAMATLFAVPSFSIAQQADQTSKSRADVQKELDAAHKDGTHMMGNEVQVPGQPKPKVTTSGKTRDQVKKELDAAHKDGTHMEGNEVQAPGHPTPKTVASGKTRDQVKKELDAAHKDGTHMEGNEVQTHKR